MSTFLSKTDRITKMQTSNNAEDVKTILSPNFHLIGSEKLQHPIPEKIHILFKCTWNTQQD